MTTADDTARRVDVEDVAAYLASRPAGAWAPSWRAALLAVAALGIVSADHVADVAGVSLPTVAASLAYWTDRGIVLCTPGAYRSTSPRRSTPVRQLFELAPRESWPT